ncbi:hypothetical protein, partial [Streptococcus hyovaginalis]|uniref:hypothetical protein n=1 Tax=Streptococcus hyovaginalis TaxID=149015 RepID=UPI002A8017ED
MKRNLRNHVISLLISVMLFIVLACLLCFYPEFLINNDNHFLTVINTIVNPVLTMAMILITQLGSPAIISVLFIIFIILTS